MTPKSQHLVILWLLAVPAVRLQAQAAPGLAPEQVMRLRAVVEAAVSLDGSSVAFVRTRPRTYDEKPGAAWRELWITGVDGRPGAERILAGGDRSLHGVAFSPDGRWLSFVEQRVGTTSPQVYGLPLEGGEAVRLSAAPEGVVDYRWRPDGGAIAYTSRDAMPAARKAARARGFDEVVVEEEFLQQSLWIEEVPDGKPRKLTEGCTVWAFEWSPDGARFAAAVSHRPLVDDQMVLSKLRVVDAADGKHSDLADNPGKLGDFAWSPDGSRVAYVAAADVRDPHAGMLYVTEPGGVPRGLTDGQPLAVQQVEWLTSEQILAAVSLGVRSELAVIDAASGARTPRPAGGGPAFRGFAWSAGADDPVVMASSATHPDELFKASTKGFVRMTDSNPWLSGVSLGRQSVFRFQARDGLPIEGLLIEPVKAATAGAGAPPMVIVVHGGPEAHWSDGWNTSYGNWGQLLAARGFVVWMPNYRASTGYGVEFAKKDHGDPMGREFEDHLDAIQALAAKGLADPARVGIGGGSYGGYTAAWAATRHTEHFAAAVSFVPFTDIRTKWYTSDIPTEFLRVHYEEKLPQEQWEFLAERSPLSFADRCRTPLLLLGGTADPRVHPSQPFMLWRAVKMHTKTPVRYVQYPGEGHGNRGCFHQFDYMLRTLQWFEHYLRPGDRRGEAPPPPELRHEGW